MCESLRKELYFNVGTGETLYITAFAQRQDCKLCSRQLALVSNDRFIGPRQKTELRLGPAPGAEVNMLLKMVNRKIKTCPFVLSPCRRTREFFNSPKRFDPPGSRERAARKLIFAKVLRVQASDNTHDRRTVRGDQS
jgi:hypothetical protein